MNTNNCNKESSISKTVAGSNDDHKKGEGNVPSVYPENWTKASTSQSNFFPPSKSISSLEKTPNASTNTDRSGTPQSTQTYSSELTKPATVNKKIEETTPVITTTTASSATATISSATATTTTQNSNGNNTSPRTFPDTPPTLTNLNSKKSRPNELSTTRTDFTNNKVTDESTRPSSVVDAQLRTAREKFTQAHETPSSSSTTKSHTPITSTTPQLSFSILNDKSKQQQQQQPQQPSSTIVAGIISSNNAFYYSNPTTSSSMPPTTSSQSFTVSSTLYHERTKHSIPVRLAPRAQLRRKAAAAKVALIEKECKWNETQIVAHSNRMVFQPGNPPFLPINEMNSLVLKSRYDFDSHYMFLSSISSFDDLLERLFVAYMSLHSLHVMPLEFAVYPSLRPKLRKMERIRRFHHDMDMREKIRRYRQRKTKGRHRFVLKSLGDRIQRINEIFNSIPFQKGQIDQSELFRFIKDNKNKQQRTTHPRLSKYNNNTMKSNRTTSTAGSKVAGKTATARTTKRVEKEKEKSSIPKRKVGRPRKNKASPVLNEVTSAIQTVPSTFSSSSSLAFQKAVPTPQRIKYNHGSTTSIPNAQLRIETSQGLSHNNINTDDNDEVEEEEQWENDNDASSADEDNIPYGSGYWSFMPRFMPGTIPSNFLGHIYPPFHAHPRLPPFSAESVLKRRHDAASALQSTNKKAKMVNNTFNSPPVTSSYNPQYPVSPWMPHVVRPPYGMNQPFIQPPFFYNNGERPHRMPAMYGYPQQTTTSPYSNTTAMAKRFSQHPLYHSHRFPPQMAYPPIPYMQPPCLFYPGSPPPQAEMATASSQVHETPSTLLQCSVHCQPDMRESAVLQHTHVDMDVPIPMMIPLQHNSVDQQFLVVDQTDHGEVINNDGSNNNDTKTSIKDSKGDSVVVVQQQQESEKEKGDPDQDPDQPKHSCNDTCEDAPATTKPATNQQQSLRNECDAKVAIILTRNKSTVEMSSPANDIVENMKRKYIDPQE
eukprot:m.91998 g.91998  ORF g.91998 m.91998 type:complete len:993 (-) comp12345_c0_seq1:177-3155(-)